MSQDPEAMKLRREIAETQRKVEAWRDAATRDADPNVVHIDVALNALREVDELLSAEVNDCECVKCQNDPMRVALGIVRAALARTQDGQQ